MKKLPIFSLLFFICIFSCQKEDVFDQYGSYGEGTAQLNGIAYKGKVTTIFDVIRYKPDTCLGINILRRNQSGEARAYISIDRIPLKIGKFLIPYTLVGVENHKKYELSYAEFTGDGDEATGNYRTYQADTTNWVNIKKLDVKTGDIEGSFQATVVRMKSYTPLGAIPDTIRITEGNFFGKINWNYL